MSTILDRYNQAPNGRYASIAAVADGPREYGLKFETSIYIVTPEQSTKLLASKHKPSAPFSYSSHHNNIALSSNMSG